MIVPIIEITKTPINRADYPLSRKFETGAAVEFSGIVRGTESGRNILGIEYEVFLEMALAEMSRIGLEVIERYELTELVCIHRSGFVPAHEAAVYVRTAARHRREAFMANMEFIERLKKNVPIWKHIAMSETNPNLDNT
jgi:molybdopterin synthase catalytic subunit